MAATATAPWASAHLTFATTDGSRFVDRTADALVEALKRTYVESDDLPVELFEEHVDVILRYRHRIDWRQCSAHIELRRNELARYPVLVEWA